MNRHPAMRQLIVRANNPQSRTVEVQKFAFVVWFLAPGSFEIRLFPVWTLLQFFRLGFALA